ncbi:AP-3 complex subunit beta [Elasticomyces elasticus]|uniref:AP-3 complex subunit beta n=1 Tax=Elasticomyces elasticus TaxID=574655 RepID=A0AAN7WBI2_9PEZI|nr:AP-3 complex subunit beta [Elasticomyces elasticus]
MESLSRISSLLETARDLTLEASASLPSRRPIKPLPPVQIKKLLDSRSERDVLDGLRRVIAMQYAQPPQPTLTFFPAVLKTLSNPYPSTRPLVYNYLIHHAELDPDTALLSINTVQKSLSDQNPRVRAMALKTMAGIRVPVISQIVSLAIKKGVSDLSPLVRKAAALACVKCARLDETTRPQVEEYLGVLLGDKQYYVAGAAVQAFVEVCGTDGKLEMIHPCYRRLCRMVVDMDEWGQLAWLRLGTVYARRCFPRRTKRTKRVQTREQQAKDFYEDLEPQEQSEQEAEYDEQEVMDPDLTLFLTSIQPLLQSRNSAVILAVAKAYLYLSPATYLHHAIGPLIALLRSPQDIQQVALHNIVQVCLAHPQHFVPYQRHFLLKSTEPSDIRGLKLEVLTLIFPFCSKEIQNMVLAELEHFSRSPDPLLVRESVRAIGRCAQSPNVATSRRCMTLLLNQIHSSDHNLIGEAMEVIRHLIQRTPNEHRKTVVRLAKNLDHLTSPTARASIVWLVGEFAGQDIGEGVAADVLRILLKGYVGEEEGVRAQIVLLAAKVYLGWLNSRKNTNGNDGAVDGGNADTGLISSGMDDDGEDRGFREETTVSEIQKPQPIELLWQHTLLLARYTPSYHLRDRARLYRALLSTPSSTELASLLLLAPKPVPQAPSPSEARRDYLLGSASLIVGEGLRSVDSLPDWVEEGKEPDSGVRDEGEVRQEYGGKVEGAKEVSAGQRLDEVLATKKGKTLDAWLNDEEESEDESGSEDATSDEATEGSSDEESEYESESDDDEQAGLVR